MPMEPDRLMILARVFALTTQDAKAIQEIIQGTFYILDFLARVLIDP